MQRLSKWPLSMGLLAAAAVVCAIALGTAMADEPARAHKGGTVLVVGDSISAAYGMQAEEGWVHLLRERLRGRAEVVNASISGDTTGGGMARLGRTLDEHEPDVVVIELGGNDGLRGYPVQTIRANLLAMAQAVVDAGAKPILAGMQIPPNYGPAYTDAFRRMYAEVAAASGAGLVPFLLEGVATERDLMQRDGIHPTAGAQPRLLDNVWPVLAGFFESAEPSSE